MSGISRANARQGRNRKRQYDAYKNENRRAKNKCRKMLRTIKRNPTDRDAIAALIKHGKELGRDYSGFRPARRTT